VAGLAEVAVRVPSEVTARIQEAHAAVCHIICQAVEEALFGGEPPRAGSAPMRP